MKKGTWGYPAFFTITASAVLFFSCKKNLTETSEETAILRDNNTVVPLAAMADVPGRTLAANCFQCHGTNGYAGELKIAGIGPSELVSKFNKFKTENPRDNIMNLHAYAYTTEEIELMGQYFSKQ
jgi:sulfide dehydrogenase cytochrome subunit